LAAWTWVGLAAGVIGHNLATAPAFATLSGALEATPVVRLLTLVVVVDGITAVRGRCLFISPVVPDAGTRLRSRSFEPVAVALRATTSWWTRRSIVAAATSLRSTSTRTPKALLEVMMRLARSSPVDTAAAC
jgi:hypothetical protein